MPKEVPSKRPPSMSHEWIISPKAGGDERIYVKVQQVAVATQLDGGLAYSQPLRDVLSRFHSGDCGEA